MATREEGANSSLQPGVVPIPDGDEAHLVDLDEWLTLVAGDEPVHPPRPAAEYLNEARQAGEV